MEQGSVWQSSFALCPLVMAPTRQDIYCSATKLGKEVGCDNLRQGQNAGVKKKWLQSVLRLGNYFWELFLAFFRVKIQLKFLLFFFFSFFWVEIFFKFFYITNLKENPNWICNWLNPIFILE
jgi:hypothetical protein